MSMFQALKRNTNLFMMIFKEDFPGKKVFPVVYLGQSSNSLPPGIDVISWDPESLANFRKLDPRILAIAE